MNHAKFQRYLEFISQFQNHDFASIVTCKQKVEAKETQISLNKNKNF